jgi:hypothetical protein
MDKIRVYEAAKKLNIETKELINLLLGKGIVVKSPISFISQEDFDNLLSSMTDTGKSKKVKPTKAKKKKQAAKSASAPKKKKSKLSLVPPLTSEEAEAQKSEKVELKPEPEPTPEQEPEKKSGTKTTPEIKKHSAPKKDEPVKPAAAKPVATSAEPKKPRTSLLSYISFVMAAAALLIAITLSSNVSDNKSGLNEINATADALKAELAGVNDGIRINQDLIFENRDSISNVMRTQARVDLSRHSVALEELAPSLPPNISSRVLNISKEMNSLAASL